MFCSYKVYISGREERTRHWRCLFHFLISERAALLRGVSPLAAASGNGLSQRSTPTSRLVSSI